MDYNKYKCIFPSSLSFFLSRCSRCPVDVSKLGESIQCVFIKETELKTLKDSLTLS